MRFHHYMGMHVATRIGGPTHNYLAITFAPEGNRPVPQVIELPPQGGCDHRALDPAVVLAEVLAGVEQGNVKFDVDYAVQSIQFVKNDTGPESVYRSMAEAIVADTKRHLADQAGSLRQLMERSESTDQCSAQE